MDDDVEVVYEANKVSSTSTASPSRTMSTVPTVIANVAGKSGQGLGRATLAALLVLLGAYAPWL